MVIDLESLGLVWFICLGLYCIIRFFRTPEKLSRREKIRKEHELERKYLVCLATGHKIKAVAYKILLNKYKEK